MSERALLLVDDEPNIMRALTRLFRRDGYRIYSAMSGTEGLEILKHNDIHVIISDQRMPSMTGIEFLSRVKDLYPDTIRIVLSGYTDLNSITNAINQGYIYKFLTKPWDDDLLRDNVKQAFEQYELRAENVRLSKELQKANEALAREIIEQDKELYLNHHILSLSREILEHMPVGVLGIGEDGVVAVANSMAHKIMKCRPGALLGINAKDELPNSLLRLCTYESSLEEGKELRVSVEIPEEIDVYCSSLLSIGGGKGAVMVMMPATSRND